MKHIPWKTVWITGAGKGIGAALAEAFSEQGCTVFISSRSEDDLIEVKQRCEPFSGKVIPAPLDITDREQIKALMKHWDREQGIPELVILNAGTHDPFPAQELSASRCERLLNINLQGTINCLEPVLQRFLEQNQGQIAVMASVAGYRGLPTAAAYGASKAALNNMCEALYLDLKGSGVKLQVINPGFVRTPLTDKNDFPMPALLEPEDAAGRIIKGLQSSNFEITFPKRFVYVLKLLRLLPLNAYLGLMGHTVKTNATVKGMKDNGKQT